MSSSEAFVDVFGAFQPRALAADLMREAHRRVHESLIVATQALRDDENPLNQLQQIELAAVASECLDGYESSAEANIREALEKIRIRDLEDEDDG